MAGNTTMADVLMQARFGGVLVLTALATTLAIASSNTPPSGSGYVVSESDDLDGDHEADLVIADPQSANANHTGRVDVRSGTDNQLLVRLKGVASGGKFGFSAWVSHDLSNDGEKDAIVGAPDEGAGKVYIFQWPFTASSEVVLLADDATFALQSPDTDSTRFGERVKAVPDLDDDGIPDVMIRGQGPNVSNDGMEFRTYFFSGATGLHILTARDVDGFDDGSAMFAKDGGEGGLPYCCGDVASAAGPGVPDGVVDITDMLLVISMWGTCPAPPQECPADCAPCGEPGGDGFVNTSDLMAVIGAWGACDFDNDGMPDTWELENGLDPEIDDADGDADGDGVSNLEEFLLGINPQATDTDGDGVDDGQEINQGTNPNDPNDFQPDPDDVIWVKVTLGDPGNDACGGIFSELWSMRIGSAVYRASPGDFSGDPQTTNKTFPCAPATGSGCGAGFKSVWTHTNLIPLKRGKSYAVTVEHQGTCFTTPLPGHPHPEDYDYTANLTVVQPPGGGTIAPHILHDPQALFGTHYDTSQSTPPWTNYAVGRTAWLHVPTLTDALPYPGPLLGPRPAARFVGDHDPFGTSVLGVPNNASVSWQVQNGAHLITGFNSNSIPAIGYYACAGTANAAEGALTIRATVSITGLSCIIDQNLTIQRYWRGEVRCRTFIECLLIPGPPVFEQWDFYKGDDRGLSYGAISFRSSQIVVATPSLEHTTGLATTPLLAFGLTQAYNETHPTTGALQIITVGGPCTYGFATIPPPTPNATGTASVNQSTIGLTAIRDLPSLPHYADARERQVRVQLYLNGSDPLEPLAVIAAINAELDVSIFQFCDPQAGMQPARVKVSGAHDGYPAFEIYAAATLIYYHLPSETGEGSLSLLPPMEWFPNTDWIVLP